MQEEVVIQSWKYNKQIKLNTKENVDVKLAEVEMNAKHESNLTKKEK